MLGERQIDEIHLPVERVAIHDGLGDADDLDRRAGEVIEPDAFADGVRTRPIVFRELLIDDSHLRRLGGIGRAEAAATQDRYAQRLEKPFVYGIHRRSEVLAISRHLKTVRHEGDGVKAVQPQRRILRESRALDSGH